MQIPYARVLRLTIRTTQDATFLAVHLAVLLLLHLYLSWHDEKPRKRSIACWKNFDAQ